MCGLCLHPCSLAKTLKTKKGEVYAIYFSAGDKAIKTSVSGQRSQLSWGQLLSHSPVSTSTSDKSWLGLIMCQSIIWKRLSYYYLSWLLNGTHKLHSRRAIQALNSLEKRTKQVNYSFSSTFYEILMATNVFRSLMLFWVDTLSQSQEHLLRIVAVPVRTHLLQPGPMKNTSRLNFTAGTLAIPPSLTMFSSLLFL